MVSVKISWEISAQDNPAGYLIPKAIDHNLILKYRRGHTGNAHK